MINNSDNNHPSIHTHYKLKKRSPQDNPSPLGCPSTPCQILGGTFVLGAYIVIQATSTGMMQAWRHPVYTHTRSQLHVLCIGQQGVGSLIPTGCHGGGVSTNCQRKFITYCIKADTSPELKGRSVLYQLLMFCDFIFYLYGIIAGGGAAIIMITEALCI